jgi:ABC-type polysaccharide/polyol phosphate transport system ATPase subunit/SAM-dependent methyltransferase
LDLVLEAREVSKRFFLRHNPSAELKVRLLGLFDLSRRQRVEEFWALRSISLKIRQGEAVGLVGRNGSGKSTFLKLIANIHRPTTGELLVARGARIGSMIELGTGFHHELTGQENVFLNASILGLSRAETQEVYDAVVTYSGLKHFMDVQLKNYSSGMHMRLGFAIAANLNPDMLLLDEIFAVGDEDFQKQCVATIKAFEAQGKTIVFVSHSPTAIQAICDRVCLIDRGRLTYDGTVDGGLTEYRRMTAASPHEALGPREEQAIAPGASAQDIDLSWHRLAAGGLWQEEGEWIVDFLRRQGLRPEDALLEIGCGSLSAASHLLRYLQQNRYWGYEKSLDLYVAGAHIELPRVGLRAELGHFIVNDDFDLSEAPQGFLFAIASSLFRRLALNSVARCIASVIKKLAPEGRFYVTWPDNPHPERFDSITWPNGSRTYSDREPFHYSFEMISAIVDAVGGRAERIDETTHPRGESVMVITRRMTS